MNRPSFVIATLLLISSASIVALPAQEFEDRAVHVGIMGGGTIPLSILSDAAKSGWNLGALMSAGTPSSPFSFRLDAQWIQLGRQGHLVFCELIVGPCPEPVDFDFRVIDGTANGVFTFPSETGTKFYVIAGAGVYGERTTRTIDGAHSTATKFGVNAGAGVHFRLGTLGGFLEARYHNVIHGSDIGDYRNQGEKPKSLQFVPISAGFIF